MVDGGHALGFFASLRMTGGENGLDNSTPGHPPEAWRGDRSARVGGERFDEDAHRRVVVQGEAGAVDEAEAGGAAGNLGDKGGLTEAHLPDALPKTFVTGQLAHAGGHAGSQLAEGR